MTVVGLVLAQIAISAAAPDTVGMREPVTVSVRVSAPAAADARLTTPTFEAFTLLRSSFTSRVDSTWIGGVWRIDEYRYVLLASRPGRFRFGPFTVRDRVSTTRSATVDVVVRPQQAGTGGPPAIVQRSRINPNRNVDFHALVVPETVFVGQQATYQAGIFLDDETRQRLRRNPEFIPPEPRSMLAYELPFSKELVPGWRSGGRRYEVHVFQRALFPLAAGRYTIPAAELTYALPISPSFFSREESFSVRSESAWVVAIEPPAAGRPPDWAGAVGDLTLDARIDSAVGRVGDPLVLTIRVRGRGNVKLFPRPTMALSWASVVPAEERVQLDSQAFVVSGTKEFDWIVTPRSAGTRELPAMRYPFFNPFSRRYEVAASRPETLTIAAGTLAAVDSGAADSARVLPIRVTWRGEIRRPAALWTAFWTVGLLAPVPAIGLAWLRRPRRRPRPRSARDELRRLAHGAAAGDVGLVRRTWLAALAERTGLSSAALTRKGALARALRRAGATPEAAEAAEALLAVLDAAAFGRGGRASDASGLAARAERVFHDVDQEARARSTLAAGMKALTVVALAGAAWMGSAQGAAETPASLFARGVVSYQARRFDEAARLFAAAADQAPLAPDAWANGGASSWMIADTAQAARRWQRALRLEPEAGDLRDRLALLPAGDAGTIADVPRIPVAWTAAGALVLWLGGWGLALLRVLRRDQWLAPAAGGALLASVVLGQVASRTENRLHASDLAVVMKTTALHALPALGSDRAGSLVVGDVARTLAREGVWTRVILDGDRDGWVESDLLASLARP